MLLLNKKTVQLIKQQKKLKRLLDALEFAESMTSKVQEWKVLTPKLKIESITLDDPDVYESILNERSIRIGNTTTKDEDITDQLHALVFDLEAEDIDVEDAYDLDAGIEQEET